MSQSKRSSRRSSKRRRKFKNKVSNFSKSVGLSPLRIILSLILLLGVGGVIYFLGISNNRLRDAEAASSTDPVKEKEEIDQLLEALFKQRITHVDNFLLSINQIQESETEISDLEASHSLTPAQEKTVARIRLKNKGSTVLQMLRNDVSHEAEKADLFRFCKSHKDAVESEIYGECRYWLCAVPTIEFAYHPSVETLATFTAAIEEYEDCFVDSPEHAELLGQILKTMITPNRKTSDLTSRGMRAIAQRMLDSETKSVRYSGEKLVLLEIFGEYDLTTLSYRIAWNNPSAAADIEGAISALENNVKIAPLYVWDVILRAYESHLSSANVEKVGAAWQRMWALSQKIESEEARKQVQVKLQRQKHRATSIGSKFDLSGFDLKGGKALELTNYDFIAVIFFDEGKQSIELIKQIVNAAELKHPDFHFLMAFKQSFTPEAIGNINDSRGYFTVVDLPTARKYYEELLVDISPYIVLVDGSGKILCTGLHFDQLETRVAQMKTNRSVSVSTSP